VLQHLRRHDRRRLQRRGRLPILTKTIRNHRNIHPGQHIRRTDPHVTSRLHHRREQQQAHRPRTHTEPTTPPRPTQRHPPRTQGLLPRQHPQRRLHTTLHQRTTHPPPYHPPHKQHEEVKPPVAEQRGGE